MSLQKAYDLRLDRILLDAIPQIEREALLLAGKAGIGAEVRRTQLAGSKVALHRAVAALWRAIGATIRAGTQEAAAMAVEKSFDWDTALLRRAFPRNSDREAMRAYLLASAGRGVEAVVARSVRSYVPLSTRVYRNDNRSRKLLEARINAALASGASATDLARSIRDLINPRTPGGISYAAKRLGRTELNNAYHAMSIEHNSDKPWVQSMAWALSKSHPKPDVCDLLALRGPYPPGQVPAKPHPHCLCYVYPVLLDEKQFDRLLAAGTFDRYFEDSYGRGGNAAGRQLA